MGDDPGRLYRLDGVAHITGVINDEETFGECPDGADEETVRRFARAYIMMLLGTQLFADKSGNRIHIRWLPFVARLEEMGGYSWGSAALAWLCFPYPTSSPTLPLRSTANDREAAGWIGGSYTGTDDEATAGLELEPATVAIMLAFRFDPPELDTTSTNFANSSGVLTSGNCL
ncbi:hypothetical protein Ahy_B04g072113 [Arachis hypogaea]|uniref:Aminotransferase-like plant mobile domain-containing protein n=1 Tax=Arachis hypogaea TaxID=3818 RepID=A0A444ZME2_ARAHY|nr:hypothetical protein Ahy_B04g072113 [Arachis hypogaea]